MKAAATCCARFSVVAYVMAALLGQEKPFLYETVYTVRDEMRGAYPDLVDSGPRVAKVVEAEEKQFDRVLKLGSTKLNEAFETQMRTALDNFSAGLGRQQTLQQIYQDFGDSRRSPFSEAPIGKQYEALVKSNYVSSIPAGERASCVAILDGATAFHLYETFGLPLDFMVDARPRRRSKF